MKTWIRAAIVTIGVSYGALAFACPAATASTAAPASTAKVQTGASATSPEATDLSARRRYRHHYRYAYRPVYRPYYYDRPYYYRPYPYDTPVPFFLGFGFGPWR